MCVGLQVTLPVRGPSLAVLVHLQHDLRGVEGRAGIGVQEKLLVLGQVLSRSLFGKSRTVEQLPLKKRQVGLHQ